jgi:hypothetical protein
MNDSGSKEYQVIDSRYGETGSSIRIVLLALVASAAVSCATNDAALTPSLPWSQTLVTQAATAFSGQMSQLYTTAYKDPSFAGERSAYGETLDTLRTLKEESAGLQAELEDGKGRDETLHRYERVKELTRDAQESSAWEFIPTDLTNSAKSALSTISTLDGFYGPR